jgi:hypothetical protein
MRGAAAQGGAAPAPPAPRSHRLFTAGGPTSLTMIPLLTSIISADCRTVAAAAATRGRGQNRGPSRAPPARAAHQPPPLPPCKVSTAVRGAG